MLFVRTRCALTSFTSDACLHPLNSIMHFLGKVPSGVMHETGSQMHNALTDQRQSDVFMCSCRHSSGPFASGIVNLHSVLVRMTHFIKMLYLRSVWRQIPDAYGGQRDIPINDIDA